MQGFRSDLCLSPLPVQAFPICDLLQFGRKAGSRACCARLSQESVLGQKAFEEELMAMRMHNPPHPGEVIKSLCLEPLGVTVTQAAEALGVSRKTLSAILNGRAGISPEMAVRLSIAFSTTAESWMNQQTQYDLWHAEQRRKRLRVMKLSA
jgi:antitoxin HigA-1